MRSSHRVLWGVTTSTLCFFAFLTLPFILATALHAQNAEQVEVSPPLHRVESPAAAASAQELEDRGDSLQAVKDYLDAIDYYQAALHKDPSNAVLMNKTGISQLQLQRYKDARRSFEHAIKVDGKYANAYANLGVVYYKQGSFAKAIRYYDKAIELDSSESVFYNNRAAAFFVKKEFEKAMADYNKALQLDPDIFERASRGPGVQAKLPSPEDIAHYDYVLAKLFARNGSPERSLHYLRKAMEEGYRDIKDVYKDSAFSEVRKDPRFAQLMASKPVSIQD